jgi:hypothetical protein
MIMMSRDDVHALVSSSFLDRASTKAFGFLSLPRTDAFVPEISTETPILEPGSPVVNVEVSTSGSLPRREVEYILDSKED